MVPPAFRRPSASAASIMVRAGRSLSEPEGFALSSLRNNRQGPRSMRVTSMRGVSPMRSSTDAMAVYSIARPTTGQRRTPDERSEIRGLCDGRSAPHFPPAVAGVMRATTARGGRRDARPSAGHPFDERPVHRIRPLHGGKVPAIGNDDEPRSGDAGGDLLRERRRGELIAIADEYQRRTFDRAQRR